ncbi:MAG: hypothetical protein WDW36_006917 [Sanguina aurantia]
MVKAYLRYEFSSSFGVITSSSNPVFDAEGKLLITSSLESISVWNIKQGSLVQSLTPQVASSSGAATGAVAEVTMLALSPFGKLLGSGYSDGTVRLWDLVTGDCLVTLKGHKTAVTALRFNKSGSQLASGSKDTDIILWDVVGETGLFRLRGHKDQVTDLAFLSSQGKLVSCSKDGYVKVWDLETQHCCQTLTGFKAEVWSLDIDPTGTRLVVGSTDQELRMYLVLGPRAAHTLSEATAAPSGGARAAAAAAGGVAATVATAGVAALAAPVLQAMGSVKRIGQDRVVSLRYTANGQMLACQGTGKTVELFRVRDPEEAVKKLKRRKKRRREKAGKKSREDGGAGDGTAEPEEDLEADVLQASDELEFLQLISMKAKVKGFALGLPDSKLAHKGVVATLALALSNNSVEILDIKEDEPTVAPAVSRRIEIGGHRADVRAVALSSDDQTLLSTSNNAVKFWNPRTGVCLGTMESGYGLCALFAPGNRHAVIGTKEGTIEVSGFVSGSADKSVKFWQWSVVSVGGAKQLRIVHTRTLKMADDVLCVRTSADGRLLAVALLDATVKVFYIDSLKFFLSLYGHKLPVLAMDISSDGTLLVTGSADKNIKVWGLDFGDCHKSLFAHKDAIMAVSFVPNTHYVFTAGKDRLVKYWDVDRCELLLELPGHHSEVWALAVAHYGDFLISGSHDRSLRRWERTSEPFFVEEEKEKRLESLFEADVEAGAEQAGGADMPAEGGESSATAGRKTLESLSAADTILEALDMAAHETQRQTEHAASLAAAAAPRPPRIPLPTNPMMLGLSPAAYVLRAVSSVRSNELEQALLLMPFSDAARLLSHLHTWLDEGLTRVELCTRVAVLLLRLHHSQLVATASLRPTLLHLQHRLRSSMQGLKDTVGFNLAAMRHLQRLSKSRAGVSASDSVLPMKRLLSSV